LDDQEGIEDFGAGFGLYKKTALIDVNLTDERVGMSRGRWL
jgi:hypothetical protein